ncbi:MAG: permease prefix domain 1-containing protein [Lachnospiraceae bacterium]|nr:permease prefix domain 1-containing protein [Lachnospiraceae bacterium]
MEEKLKSYVENLFNDVPKTKKAVDLKEEITSNLLDKFNDLKSSGKTEDESYKIAIASIGDIGELTANLKDKVSLNYEGIEKSRKKSALLISIAVGLYIFSIIPVIGFGMIEGNDFLNSLGIIFMFAFCGIATMLIVYSYIARPKYEKIDDTMVEEFKEWKSSKEKKNLKVKGIQSAMWCLIVSFYFIYSFTVGNWHISWVIFLIGAAIEEIIKTVLKD